jgi:hypothetical protein
LTRYHAAAHKKHTGGGGFIEPPQSSGGFGPGGGAGEAMGREHGQQSLAAFEDLWHAKRGERALPARRDFTFDDLRPWVGRIRVVRVTHDPIRFQVTLDGSEIVNTIGIDLTGRFLDVVYGAERLRFLLDPYLRVVTEKVPCLDVLRPNDRLAHFGEIARMLLPCGDGGVVSHILYCEYAQNVYHWGRTVFANLDDLNLSPPDGGSCGN